jgi:NAD(P)-dependent dehydrogenase (short-subunit alcohol dehydrogenase family)
MQMFRDKVAIITGGASGIGRAVARQLALSGATVVVADIQGEQAKTWAGELAAAGGKATGVRIDVADAAAVQRLVDETVSQHGRLDYMFNNAGIGIIGELRDQSLEAWGRLLDVNLRGVINGVTAAYQVMLRQKSGHIVNTSSLSGLVPTPGLTAYATTKHALIGLSTSLRAEAAALGVKVSVACPGFVATPLQRSSTYLNMDPEEAIANTPGFYMDVEDCARLLLRGVARNRSLIIISWQSRLAWWLYRISPALVQWVVKVGFAKVRALRKSPEPAAVAARDQPELRT